MFPYRDENETIRTPIITFAIIGVNAVVWLLVQGAGAPVPLAASVCNLGLIPAELLLTAQVGDAFPIGQHIGGFIVGAALVKLFARKDYVVQHQARHWKPQHQGWRR